MTKKSEKVNRRIRQFLSAPFIYFMIFPAIILHITIEIYQQICFRLYRIPRVKFKNYFLFNRALMPYLSHFERFNCYYCSYFNGLMSYSKEIAGKTERYWCPLKHSKKIFGAHSQYNKFLDSQDKEDFREKWLKLKKFEEKNKKN